MIYGLLLVWKARYSSWTILGFLGNVEERVNVEKLVDLGTTVCSTCYHFPFLFFAPCKVIRIPESRKFLLVESGILGSGIQNPAFGIQDPAKKESTCWKSISNRINGFHLHPCNHCTVQFTHVVNRCSNLESVYITEAFKSHRICLEHQYGRYLIVLEHL